MNRFSTGLRKLPSEHTKRTMIKYICLAEFEKDFKALQKRYRTLAEDFETFKKFTIETFYEMNVPSTAFIPIEGFCGKNYTANKVRKFACKSLPGRGNQSEISLESE